MKATLPDIKLPEDSNQILRKKDYDRPDVIAAKKEELEKFFKFNVIKSVPRAPRNAEVITEKSDNMSKTGSKVKTRLCTMGNSAKEFSKDSVQFESPTCGRDTVKALLSLVPDNKWRIATFDVSSAFFQGDSLQREVYVKDPEGPGFWVLNTALYGLCEGARNWYDRFHRHCISLSFTTAPGDPVAYSYDRDGIRASLAIHVDGAITKSTIDLHCYVEASYNQATDTGVKFNVRGSISGLMGRNDTFSPVNWKTSEIRRKISSVKSAELFALDHGAGQLCY